MKIETFEGEHRFLSNFFMAAVRYQGVEYPSSEHLYQALKTQDPIQREWVRQSSTPGIAKKRGKEVTIRDNWTGIKDDLMDLVLALKFEQHPNLEEKLLATSCLQ